MRADVPYKRLGQARMKSPAAMTIILQKKNPCLWGMSHHHITGWSVCSLYSLCWLNTAHTPHSITGWSRAVLYIWELVFQYHEEYSSVSVTHTMERVSHEKGNSVLLYPASPLLQFEEKSIIPSIPQFFSSPSSFSQSLLQIISSLVQHHHFVVAPSVTFWIMSSLVPLFPSVTPSGL